MQREGITILQLVPSMAALFVEDPGFPACATLRRLFCGGEPLPPALCESFFARLPGRELVNLYGPTECAIDTVFHRCQPGAASVPIGRPVANTRLYVVDPQGELVPPGARGELCIAGAQLARGYWNQPELTARAFVQCQGERVYKTGDLVRWNEAGELEFLGRADDQLKIRGQRIEPAEIESVLKRQPGVRECAVVAHEEESGAKRLVAYVTPDRSGRMELWPSSPSAGGEQFFDESLYRAMTNDRAAQRPLPRGLRPHGARQGRDRYRHRQGRHPGAPLRGGGRAEGLRGGVAGIRRRPGARAWCESSRLEERIVVVQGDITHPAACRSFARSASRKTSATSAARKAGT